MNPNPNKWWIPYNASNFWFKVASKYNTLKHISAYHYWHYYVLQLKIVRVGTFKHLFSNQILNLPFIWGTFIKFRPVLPEIMGLTDANIQTLRFVRHMSGRYRSNSPNLMCVIRYNIRYETSLNSVRSSFYNKLLYCETSHIRSKSYSSWDSRPGPTYSKIWRLKNCRFLGAISFLRLGVFE